MGTPAIEYILKVIYKICYEKYIFEILTMITTISSILKLTC